jgi:hypothetical protein
MMNIGMSPTELAIYMAFRKAFDVPIGEEFPTQRAAALDRADFSVDDEGYAVLRNFPPLVEGVRNLNSQKGKGSPSRTVVVAELLKQLAIWLRNRMEVKGDHFEVFGVLLGMVKAGVKSDRAPKNSSNERMTALVIGHDLSGQGNSMARTGLDATCLCVYAPLLATAPTGGPGNDVYSTRLPPRPKRAGWVEGVSGPAFLDEYDVFPPTQRASPDAPMDYSDVFGKHERDCPTTLRPRPDESYTGHQVADLTDAARETVVMRDRANLIAAMDAEKAVLDSKSERLTREVSAHTTAVAQARNRRQALAQENLQIELDSWTNQLADVERRREELARNIDNVSRHQDNVEKAMFTVRNHGVASKEALETALATSLIEEKEYLQMLNRSRTAHEFIFVHRCLEQDMARGRLVGLGLCTPDNAHLHVAFPSNTQRLLRSWQRVADLAVCLLKSSSRGLDYAGAPANERDLYSSFTDQVISHWILMCGYADSMPGGNMLGRIAEFIKVMSIHKLSAKAVAITVEGYPRSGLSPREYVDSLRPGLEVREPIPDKVTRDPEHPAMSVVESFPDRVHVYPFYSPL